MIVNSLSDQRSGQTALLTFLYQVAEGFHAFTAVIMFLLLLCIGKKWIRKCSQEIVARNA
jgi:hypothetical protein